MRKRTFLNLLVLLNTVLMATLCKAADSDEKKLARDRKFH